MGRHLPARGAHHRSATPRRLLVVAVVACMATLAGGCSGARGRKDSAATTTATSTAPARPSVTPATLRGPITQGAISLPADPRPVDLAAAGYVQEEFFASGVARAFAADGPLGPNGRWHVTVSGSAPYTTRVVVRRPSDPSRLSGVVVVEWLNVSVAEAAPEWAYTHRAIPLTLEPPG